MSGYARPVALYNLGLGRRDDVARNFFTASVWFGESKAVKGEINGDARKSCAAPTVSGIVAMLNDVRLKAGKSTLGFLNPFLVTWP